MAQNKRQRNKRRKKKSPQPQAEVETDAVDWPPGKWTAFEKTFVLEYVTPGPDGRLPEAHNVVRKLKPGHTNPWQAAGRLLAKPHIAAFVRKQDAELIKTKRFTRAQAFDNLAYLYGESVEEIERQKAAVFEAPSKSGPVTVGIGNPVPAITTAAKITDAMLKLTGQDVPEKLDVAVSGRTDKPPVKVGVSLEKIDAIKRGVLGVET